MAASSTWNPASPRVPAKPSGHRVESGGDGYGGYQAILRDAVNGVYLGASESRKDGHAAGY